MKIQFIYIISFSFYLAGGLQAQTCSSRKLAETSEAFPKICLPATDSTFICPQIIEGKSFTVKYNAKNEIEHLGVSLFSPETKELINQPVCNFIERLILELILQKTTTKQQEKLKEYDIQIRKTGLQSKNDKISIDRFLHEIDCPTTFSLQTDGNRFYATWEYGMNEVFALSFPASRELIFGTDKKESDDEITSLFTNHICSEQAGSEDLQLSYEDLHRIIGTDIFRRKGAVFMINEINSDIYLQKNDTLFQPVFDPIYPSESLANLFLVENNNLSNLRLKITHRRYGNFTPEFEIPLREFTCLFKQDFNIYSGIQNGSKERVKLAVILQSKSYNFIHMLLINTTKEQLFVEDGIINANFFTNIPQHNIKNLFN
jgi:hypothetical protein